MFDDKIILQHASGKIQSKNENLENLKSGMQDYNKIDVKENSVRIIGATAILISNVDFNVSINGEKKISIFHLPKCIQKTKKAGV